MGFLTGKKALITGLISQKSMAYGIAKAMHQQGASLAFTYQNERFKERIIKLIANFKTDIAIPCDVSCDQEIDNLFNELARHWSTIDILIHSIAYAPSDQLQGSYVHHLNRKAFQIAHDISSYSFSALAQHALPFMKDHPSAMLCLSYIGSVRTIPNYNLMGVAKASLEANMRYMAYDLGQYGIRVNAISAGPVRTLAASGIKNFRKMLAIDAQLSPLKQNTTIEQVGNVAAFLCSDLASGITGEILHVDNGFHITGGSFNRDDQKTM